MNYDDVKKFYPTAVQICNILYNRDCSFQIDTYKYILHKDNKKVTITPQLGDSTLTLKTCDATHIDEMKLIEIDSDLWFNLSVEYQLPFGYDCIKKLKDTESNFHILMTLQ